MSEPIRLAITSGTIEHPLWSEGRARKGWAAYVYRRGPRVVQLQDGFLEKYQDGQFIESTQIVRGCILKFAVEVRSAIGADFEKQQRLFRVEAIDHTTLTLQPISEDQVPCLSDLDPTANPGIRWLLGEISLAKSYLSRLEQVAVELLDGEKRRRELRD